MTYQIYNYSNDPLSASSRNIDSILIHFCKNIFFSLSIDKTRNNIIIHMTPNLYLLEQNYSNLKPFLQKHILSISC